LVALAQKRGVTVSAVVREMIRKGLNEVGKGEEGK